MANVVVAQLGSRRHYAVPLAFHSAGQLCRFYTDLFLGQRHMRSAATFISSLSNENVGRRLLGRFDPAIPASRVRSFPVFGAEYQIRLRLAQRHGSSAKAWLWAGQRFCNLILRDGFREGDIVYAYSSAALELFEVAKASGLRCVLDHATAPKSYEDALTRLQIERYPGWSVAPAEDPWCEEYTERQERECHLADTIVCNSSFVRDSIHNQFGVQQNTQIVPLGLKSVGPKPDRPERLDEELRVLFVGDDGIRKGLGDFVEAIKIFGKSRCLARVVGNIQLTTTGKQQAGQFVELVGPVPRLEMEQQYAWADVFVLPSVSDTFGLVVLEALASGVPAIVTHNTGARDIIRDGTDGFIVPIMSPQTIAEKLELLHKDRQLLRQLSECAYERAQQVSTQSYFANLVDVTCGLN